MSIGTLFSLFLPRHHPFSSPSLPSIRSSESLINFNWLGALGEKLCSTVANFSVYGHNKHNFRLMHNRIFIKMKFN